MLAIPMLRRISLPYVKRRRGRVALVVLSVSLGIAAIVATGTLVDSAVVSMEENSANRTSLGVLQISNGYSGVPESMLDEVGSTKGVASAAAVITGAVRFTDPQTDLPPDLLIIGIDLFDPSKIHQSWIDRNDLDVLDESIFATDLGALILTRDFADRLGVDLGSHFSVSTSTGIHGMTLAGLMPTRRELALLGGNVAIMDIFSAQALLSRSGLFDSIDVTVVPEQTNQAISGRLSKLIGGRATIQTAERGGSFRSLLHSTRLVLSVAGALAIVVGALVIYHTLSMEVSLRRSQLDIVRELGAPRSAIIALLSGEAAILGLAGAVIGTLTGIALAWIASAIFSQLLGVLYRPLALPGFSVSWVSVTKAIVLGLVLSVGASLGPVLSATKTLASLSTESPARERLKRSLRHGRFGALCLIGAFACALLIRPPIDAELLAQLSVGRDMLTLLGLGLILPAAAILLARRSPTRRLRTRWVALKLAWNGVSSDPARSATVLASIMVGAAYVIISFGVVTSLRDGVLDWVGASQKSDLFVTAAGSVGILPASPKLPPTLKPIIEQAPGVATVDTLRLVAQPHRDRWAAIAAREPDSLGTRYPLRVIDGNLAEARQAVSDGTGAIVSQHFAEKFDYSIGDKVSLRSPTGLVTLKIESIVVDYTGGDLGAVYLSPEKFREHWRDIGITSFQIGVIPGTDLTALREHLAALLSEHCMCQLLTQNEFRNTIGGVVSAVFYTAYALESVAVIVMIIAIISFFNITLDERRDEISTLRDIGATRSQLVRSFLLEGALLGAIGGALGSLVGTGLARQMVLTTMRIGGGMVVDFRVPVGAYVASVAGVALLCTLSCLPIILRHVQPRLSDGRPAGD